MTAAPQGQPQGQAAPSWQTRGAGAPARGTATSAGAAVAAPGRPTAPQTAPAPQSSSRRRLARLDSPNRLRLVRSLAAAACLIPGLVAMVEIATAATAPVSSPTQTYADLRAAAATYEARATVAASPGGSAAQAEAAAVTLSRATTQAGAAALLYPSRATEIYRASDELAKRQATTQASTAKREGATNASTATVPAPSPELKSALTALQNPPPARAVANANHVVIAGVLGLIGLVGASVWLAGKSRRVINPGVALATVLTAGVTVLGFQVMSGSGTSSAVDGIAELRAHAAESVAAEASALYADSTTAGSALDRAASARANGDRALGDSAAWTSRAGTDWESFAAKALTSTQLTGGTVQARQALIAGRLGDLDALNGKLAGLANDYGAGADPRPNALAGYGLFGLSLLAGAAAWTGVGRRLAEYR